MFQLFPLLPAGYGDFPSSFLQDPVAGIIDLGSFCPRSNNPARKMPILGISGDFVEAVFRPKIFRICPNDFRQVPTGKYKELAGIHRKKSAKFSSRNTASMFRWVPVLSCRIRWLFRIFPAGSGGRNHRPGYLSFPRTGNKQNSSYCFRTTRGTQTQNGVNTAVNHRPWFQWKTARTRPVFDRKRP